MAASSKADYWFRQRNERERKEGLALRKSEIIFGRKDNDNQFGLITRAEHAMKQNLILAFVHARLPFLPAPIDNLKTSNLLLLIMLIKTDFTHGQKTPCGLKKSLRGASRTRLIIHESNFTKFSLLSKMKNFSKHIFKNDAFKNKK